MEFRFDVAQISNVKRTPQGGLEIPAALTRTGVFEYHRADGSVQREYRPPEEVFSADSTETLRGAPLTVGHQGLVNPDNYQRVSVGHVADEVKQDQRFVAARVRVQHGDAVNQVQSKKLVELSCGYTCDVDHKPGVTPDGEHYDAIQRNIRYNHVALLPEGGGRAGSEVKLRMDGKDLPVAGTYNDHMELAEALKEIERLKGELAGANARADSVTQKLDAIDVDALVSDRLALYEEARAVLGAEAKFDGKDTVAIMRETCQKAYPEMKFDGKESEDYLRGLFAGAVKQAVASAEHVAKINRNAPRADAAGVEDKVKTAREANARRSKDAWKGVKR